MDSNRQIGKRDEKEGTGGKTKKGKKSSDGYESKNYESNLVESARLRIESNRISNRIESRYGIINAVKFKVFSSFLYFYLLYTDTPEGLLLRNKKK